MNSRIRSIAAFAVGGMLAPHALSSQSRPSAPPTPPSANAASAPVVPNELGRIPILEYHLVGPRESRWSRSSDNFRRDLELLYARGYRPVTVAELVDKKLDLPRGTSPVVFTFDDASPGQFSYVKRPDGTLVPDPNSAIGIWLDFARTHPGWGTKATFCVLSNANEGHAFFGNKGIAGQESAWRFPKLRWLVERGFELCNHTLYHVKLSKVDERMVRLQIGRAQMAIDSAVPGYRVRTFALPLGLWPKDRSLVMEGSWREEKATKAVTWRHDAVLEVAEVKGVGAFSLSPHDPRFNARSLPRVQVFGDQLRIMLDRLEKSGNRYVSDGNPSTIAKPASTASK